MDERAYWIGFNLVKGIGAVRFQSLLDHFGDAESAWNATPEGLSQAGLSEKIIERFNDLKSSLDLEKYWASIQEQGREVFAVPGNIMAPQSKGCNRLIANGARPMLKAEDVLEALDLTRNIERREVRRVVPSDATEAALLELLNIEPLHVDDIRAQSGLPIEKITSALTMMELKGMVRQVGKMDYVAVREDRANYEVEKG